MKAECRASLTKPNENPPTGTFKAIFTIILSWGQLVDQEQYT